MHFLLFSLAAISSAEPYTPGPEFNLVPLNWDGQPIPFNTNVTYTCANGMKMEESFDQALVISKTNDGANWDEPSGGWQKCVTSKQNRTLLICWMHCNLFFSQPRNASCLLTPQLA